jgi:hypothetical protein
VGEGDHIFFLSLRAERGNRELCMPAIASFLAMTSLLIKKDSPKVILQKTGICFLASIFHPFKILASEGKFLYGLR